MLLARRGLLTKIGAGLAMPAIVRTAGLLMPVRPAPIRQSQFTYMPPGSVIAFDDLNAAMAVIHNGKPAYARMADVMQYIRS